MKPFMDRDFLLHSSTARHLYHDIAANLPIIDYHCHLSPREIWEDRRFENITQIWLGGDHYKWRLMRSWGIEERRITGTASDREKFQAWAETLRLAAGNPLYHWSHLELKNYFDWTQPLTPENAEAAWEHCNRQLSQPDFSARQLILRSRVEVICTTDDPADELRWHRQLQQSDFPVKVLPSFRPDRALGVEKPDFTAYLKDLGHAADVEIDSYAALVQALERRMDAFDALGCRVSDHGLDAVPFAPATEDEVEAIFARRLEGEALTALEQRRFKTALLQALGRGYAQRGWVMQLHFGVIRDNSKRIFRALGPDAGIDSIGDQVSVADLAAFLNSLDETDQLPRTVLYSLNPNDNTAIGTVIGCFQGPEARGKVQHGSAWWFNDHKNGMRAQLESLAAEGHLGTFVGMLTDSRSFLSYARHEYFRRILCDLLGTWVEEGEYPADEAALSALVTGICHHNAAAYLQV